MTNDNEFVRRLLADKRVLPRARAIGLARLLCRQDIVQHLLTHSANVRSGQLPKHMQSVFQAAEGTMLGQNIASRVAGATRRHDETGVTLEQRTFVWATFVDAYMTAASLAGYRPTVAEVQQYTRGARSFGRAFGITEPGAGMNEVRLMARGFMNGIAPETVLAGGWNSIVQVASSPWFGSDCDIQMAEVATAVEHAIPAGLVAVLRRR